jgi:hypothetical protein
MRKSHLYLVAVLLLAFLFFSFNAAKNKSQIEDYQPMFSGGPGTGGLGDRTGSPLSSATCSQCHSGGSFNAAIGVQVLDGSTPVTSYTAGNTYTVVYTISGSSPAFGFQGGVLTSTNAAGGTFSSPSSNAQLVTISGRSYFEHDGGPSSTGVFQASWTAPLANTGTVSFYGVGLAVNQNGGTSGDQTTAPVVISLTEDVTCVPTNGIDVQTACESYDWIDGNTYNSDNNTATHTLTNVAGCDSVITLDLTIKQSSSSMDTHVACDNFTWIDGNTYTSNNNSATHTLSNAVGCDSVVTLDLTINNSNTGIDTQVACDTYTWIDGVTYSSSNNTATHTLTNAGGCDSVVSLNLTINTVDNSVTQSGVNLSANVTGATYQWLDCDNNNAVINGETDQNYTASVNGDYAVQITESGCVDTSDCFSIASVNIFENSFGKELVIFPNPTKGNFSIDLGSNFESTKINIMDINGELIQRKIFYKSQNLNLNLTAPNGVYILSIESGLQKATIRLIKE